MLPDYVTLQVRRCGFIIQHGVIELITMNGLLCEPFCHGVSSLNISCMWTVIKAALSCFLFDQIVSYCLYYQKALNNLQNLYYSTGLDGTTISLMFQTL